jgi:hypothetical protein
MHLKYSVGLKYVTNTLIMSRLLSIIRSFYVMLFPDFLVRASNFSRRVLHSAPRNAF